MDIIEQFKKAPKVWCTPAGSLVAKGCYGFLPVHQYPIGFDVEEHEFGALACFGRNGEIKKVQSRTFIKSLGD